eukprot:gene12127-biopygen7915
MERAECTNAKNHSFWDRDQHFSTGGRAVPFWHRRFMCHGDPPIPFVCHGNSPPPTYLRLESGLQHARSPGGTADTPLVGLAYGPRTDSPAGAVFEHLWHLKGPRTRAMG